MSESGVQLTDDSERDLAALRRDLQRAQHFALFFVLADGPARAEVRSRLRAWQGEDRVPMMRFFPEGGAGAKAVLDWLADTEVTLLNGAVIVDGDTLVEQKTPIHMLNVARDTLGRLVAGPLVIVLAPQRQTELSRLAPDLWDVRRATRIVEAQKTSIYPPASAKEARSTATPIVQQLAPLPGSGPPPPASPAAPAPAHSPYPEPEARPSPKIASPQGPSTQRSGAPDAATLRAQERSPEPPPPTALANGWLRLAISATAEGRWEDALEAATDAIRIARTTDYFDAVAAALGIQARAHLAAERVPEAERAAREALSIATEHLGDAARAQALDTLATVLQAQDRLAEALSLRRNEQVPVLERLGDLRGRAGALRKIAGLFAATGDIDQAIRVLRREVTPLFEELADAAEQAATTKQIAELLETRGEEEEGLAQRIDAERPASPFPGLEPYDEARAPQFFGRDAEIKEALEKLAEPDPQLRWLQIDGPSGAGKSSFASAGILPAVRAGRIQNAPSAWITVTMRPGHDPVSSLAEALATRARPKLPGVGTSDEVRARLAGSPTALADLVRARCPAGHGVLLLVDQLEEVFTLAHGDAGSVRRFDGLLAAALDDRAAPLLLVTVIRSDFVARMGELPELEQRLSSAAVRYYLGPMREAGLRQAIEKPAERAGLSYEPGLVERILGDARSSRGALPLVAHVLQALYATRDGTVMTLRAYERLGGVGGALAKSADAILQGLAPDDRARAKRLLLRLVTIGRGVEPTRQAVSREEALSAAGEGPESERVLSRLSGGRAGESTGPHDATARLVVVTGEPGRERVDLVHEALIQRWDTLRAWIKEARDALELRDDVEEAARIWEASGAAQDALPRGTLLGRFKGVERGGLREGARRYLEAAERLEDLAETERNRREAESQRASEAKARARKLARIRMWVLLILVPLVVAVVVWQVTKSRDTEQVAEARRLALEASSGNLPGGRPAELLLLVEAWRAAQKSGRPFFPEIEQALGDRVRPGEDGLTYRLDFEGGRVVALGPDLRSILIAYSDKAKMVPLGSGVPVLLTGHEAEVVGADFRPDCRRVVTASADRTARIWDTTGHGEHIVLRGHEGGVSTAAFSPDGTLVATGSGDRTARIWSADGGPARAVLSGPKTGIVDIAFSPDGVRVATASAGGVTYVWNTDGSGLPMALLGHEGIVFSVRFSPDGKRLATGSMDRTARIWNVEGTGSPLVLRHDASVYRVQFSPDGSRLMTVSAAGAIRLWDATAPSTPIVLGSPADRAVFGPDGKQVLSAFGTGWVRYWTVDAEDLARSACAQAGRNFTMDEWRGFFEDVPYRATCPEWPAPAPVSASASVTQPASLPSPTALPLATPGVVPSAGGASDNPAPPTAPVPEPSR